MFKKKYFVLDNDKFGSWQVKIADVGKSRALCSCVCGELRKVKVADLVTGRSRSCGKKVCGGNFVNLTNMKFGFLLVLNDSLSKGVNGSIKWNCLCICGKELVVSSKHLMSGATKSCGCNSSLLRVSKIKLLPDNILATNKIFDRYKRAASQRNLNFELNYNDFSNLIKLNCYYCNINPQMVISIKRVINSVEFYYNGIDRVDNNKGYIIDNCVTCCSDCNFAKRNKKIEDFMNWIERFKQK